MAQPNGCVSVLGPLHARPEIDYVLGATDGVLGVFDHHDGVAFAIQLGKGVEPVFPQRAPGTSVRLVCPSHLRGDLAQACIASPQTRRVRQRGRCQKVGIDIADPSPHQGVALNEKQHFGISGNGRLRQRLEEPQHGFAITQISAGQLPHHERVCQHQVAIEQGCQLFVADAQMIDSDRGIH